MLKLNVGLSRKIGEANYGSRGASVNLEVELESGLVTQPEQLQEHNDGHRGRRGRRATRSQILAIHGIATRQGIDLDGLLRDRYRVCQLYELSASEASRLIDELKASANKAEGPR